MQVEYFDRLGKPRREPASRVVVYDHLGNPLAVLVETQPGAHFVATCSDANFNTVLRQLGILKTVVCTDLAETPLDQIRFDRQTL